MLLQALVQHCHKLARGGAVFERIGAFIPGRILVSVEMGFELVVTGGDEVQ